MDTHVLGIIGSSDDGALKGRPVAAWGNRSLAVFGLATLVTKYGPGGIRDRKRITALFRVGDSAVFGDQVLRVATCNCGDIASHNGSATL